MQSSAPERLTLQFSISLPDKTSSTGFKFRTIPDAMRWSPDGRTLALFGNADLFLLDVEQKQIRDLNIDVRGGPPNLAWSADGSMMAVSKIDVRLFRAADGKELGRRDKVRYGRCTLSPRQGAAFTADGRFLWVGCGARGERGGYRAAEKLTVPDLEPADSVDVEATAPDYISFTDYERIAIEDGRMLLSSILQSCEKQPNKADPLRNCQSYATCFDLQTKQRCFPSFVIPRSTGTHYLYDLKLVPGRPQVMTFWAWSQGIPRGPDPAFTIQDFAGNQVRQFGVRDEFRTSAPHQFAVTEAGFVIGTAGNFGDIKDGRLMMWNAQDGKLLQNTRTDDALLIEVSPDGRLVAATIGSEVKVYSIIRSEQP